MKNKKQELISEFVNLYRHNNGSNAGLSSTMFDKWSIKYLIQCINSQKMMIEINKGGK